MDVVLEIKFEEEFCLGAKTTDYSTETRSSALC